MKTLRSLTIEGHALTPCVYCGTTATCRDHFVPRAYRKIIENWRSQKGWERVPDTVPACHECNGIAGANIFATLSEKRAYIHGELRRKHAKLLAYAFWSEDELQSLGRTLRTHILKNEAKRMRLLLRLSWPYDVGDEVEALTLSLSRSDDPALALNEIRREEILA